MEQPPHQSVERQPTIEQFVVFYRAGKHRDMPPFGVVELGMDSLAPFLALGQMLEDDPARDPSVIVPNFPAATSRREPNDRRDLLGLGEIALRREGQAAAFQRNDSLVAFLGRCPIEGDRQIALAEQRE